MMVDWRGCEAAHTAVIQVLMAARPKLLGPPATDLLEKWVRPVLAATMRQMTQKILIVDDSKLARMAVIKALNALRPDWTRMEASNADEALTLIRNTPRMLPCWISTCLARTAWRWQSRYRQLAPQISLAVISANHQVEVIERARAAGAYFLPKPLTEKSLGEFLNSASK